MDYRSAIVDDELVAVIEAPFDGSIAPRVHGELAEAFAKGVKRVVIDLCECPHVDDGAIAVLAAAAVTANSRGGQLFLALDSDVLVEIADAALVRAVFGR